MTTTVPEGDGEAAAEPQSLATAAAGNAAAGGDVWSAATPGARARQGMKLPVSPLLAAAVVLLLAQVVLTILLLGTVQQLRDQTASSSGFQRCEARAVTGSTDNATYRKAIQDCLNR